MKLPIRFPANILSNHGRSGLILRAMVLWLACLPTAKASFHLMQIFEVIGGVNGDSSAQAIELRMRAGGQTFLAGNAKLVAVDAAGANPVTLIDFGSNVAIGNFGSAILITSSSFKEHTANPGSFSNDFTLTNLIPVAYLDAGRLLYEDSSSNILWSLAFGGPNYTGPTNGETTNGPADPGKYGGPLPERTMQALLYQGSPAGLNANNPTDYALTPGAATITNNAGKNFTVVPEPSSSLLVGVSIIMLVVVGRRHLRAVQQKTV